MKKLFRSLALLLVMGNAMAQVPTNGLVAYYPFNGDANDATSNSLHGTVNGAILSADRFGNANKSYSFDGSSNYITFPAFPEFYTGNFSISIWLKSADIPTTRSYTSFICLGPTAANQTFNFAYDRSNANFSYWDYSNSSYYFTTNADKVVDKWAHILINYKDGVVTNYVNGVSSGSQSISNIVSRGNNQLQIGAYGPDEQYFAGDIDDIRVYDRALESAEILALANENCDPYFTQSQVISFDGNNLSIPANNGSTYTWTFNGTPISGTISNVYSGTLNAGEYGVTVTNGSCNAYATYTQTSDEVNLTKGLKAYYPFNGDANDASGNNINGTVNGAVLTNGFNNAQNSAYYFDGASGSSNISFNEIPTTNVRNWTISTWLKPSDLSQTGFAVMVGADNGSNYGDGYGIGISGGNRLNALYSFIGFYDGGYDFNETTKWHHTVITNDFEGKLSFYVDGTLTNIVYPQEPLTPTNFSIGAQLYNNTTTRNFKGSIDEVKIYDRALTATEILTLAQENCSNYFAVAPVIQLDGTNLVSTSYQDAQYAWTYNGSPISGQTSNVYTSTLSAGEYGVIVTNGVCNANASFTQSTDVVDLTKDLEADYLLDGNANDASPKGNNGIENGISYVANRFGTTNSAAYFDGNSSGLDPFIKFPADYGVQGKSFTYSVWLKPDQDNVTKNEYPLFMNFYNNTLSDGENSYLSWYGQILGSAYAPGEQGFVNTGRLLNSNSNINVSGNSPISTDGWTNIVLVADQNTGVLSMYRNGILENTLEGQDLSDQKAFNNLIVGREYDGGANNYASTYYSGALDNIKIFSRTLNTSEIHSLYTDGCPGFQSPTFSYGSNPYCKTGSATPTGTFANGSFTSDAGLVIDPTTGSIDLTASTAGEYTITYTIPAQYGCSSQSATASVSITEVTNTTDATSLCANGSSTKSFTGSSNIVAWNISPASLSANLSGNVFTAPNAANTVSIYATDVNGCQSPSITFEVYALPVITNVETSIVASSDLNLTGSNGDSWSIISGSATLNSNVLTVGNTPGTSITVRFTSAVSNCFVEKTFQVVGAYATEDASTYDCSTLPFTVPVVVTSPVNSGIIGLDLDLTFDPSIMVPTGNYTIGSVVSDNGQSLTDVRFDTDRIQASIAYGDQGSLSGSGVIINFEFTLVPGVTQGLYDLPSGTLTESYLLTNKDVEVKAGKLNVIHFYPTLEGKVIFRDDAALPVFNNSNPASGVTTVYAADNCVNTGTTASTDNQGNFNIQLSDEGFSVKIDRTIPSGTLVNSAINGFDGSLVAKISNGKNTAPTAFELIAADVNGDGRVLSGDRTLIMNRSVLNSDHFPIADWKFVVQGTVFTGFDRNNVPSVASCMEVPSTIQDGCTNLTPQIYSGILIGDVNGNYSTTPNGSNLRTDGTVEAVLDLNSVTLVQPNVYRAPIKVNSSKTIYSVDVEMNFNKGAVSSVKAISNARHASYLMVYNVIRDKLLVSTSFNDTLDKSKDALYIDFYTDNLDSIKVSYLDILLNGDHATSSVLKSGRVTDATVTNIYSSESMNVYPNPSQSGVFQLDLNSLVSEDGSVEVMDMFGRNIYKSSTSNANHLTIDLSNVENGTYILKVKSGDSVKVKSLIVEK